MSALPQRRQFTVDEYYRMADAGILAVEEPVELIAGEVVEMSPTGSRHAACVKRLIRWLAAALGEDAILSVQDPVRLDDFSEPEPDVAVLRPRGDFYASAHPGAEDVLWLVEVSDSSLEFDRQVKLPLYSSHGVPEVWVVNLPEETVEVYSRPGGGGYARTRRFHRGNRLALPGFPQVELAADALLG